MPVRVVRGHQSKTSYVGKVYTYDGLYKVGLSVICIMIMPNIFCIITLLNFKAIFCFSR